MIQDQVPQVFDHELLKVHRKCAVITHTHHRHVQLTPAHFLRTFSNSQLRHLVLAVSTEVLECPPLAILGQSNWWAIKLQ